MNDENERYLMRSLLFVPGHNERLQQSAAKSNADVILLDIEDSVLPISAKQVARDKVEENVKKGLFKNYEVFVRINERNTGQLLLDVCQLTIDGVTGFLYSKTNTANDIVFFDKLLEAIEYERGFPIGKFKIIPILETAESIVNANEIAIASKRNVAIGFGSEDFVSDLEGIRDFEACVSIFNPRAWVAIVARAHKLIPIDAAYIHVHDNEGLEKHLKVGRTLGYAGMWLLHPKQIELVNKCYAPSTQEIEEAKNIYELFTEAQNIGKGVAIINGQFIGPPLVVKAERILNRANLIKEKGK